MNNKINFENIYKQIIKENNDQYLNTFKNNFKLGENDLYLNKRTEIKSFDETWIDTLESYFPSLNKIVLNPKSDLKYEQEVVLVEKARKITSDSIKHLASNTKYIKSIDDEGMVVPKKILNTYSDIQYATYENRFIKTLIERLFHFVRRRYKVIKDNVESFKRTRLILNTNFPFGDENIDVNLDINVKEELENKEINEYNLKLLKRVEQLNKLITGFYQSEFMKNLEKANNIHPPIMKTQIILKNVDYNNAYLLWLFLDKYNTLAYDLDVTDEKVEINNNFLNNAEEIILLNYLSLLNNQNNKSLNVIETINKSKKGFNVIATHPKDLLENPEYLKMESNTANEYYLNQQKTLFEENYLKHSKDVVLEDTALKRAMRDLDSITNVLYEAYFEFDLDDDIFRRLITKDPLNEFNNLKSQSHYSKLIREVKEVSYNDSIRLERRIIKRILELDNYLINESKKRRILTAKELEEILLKEHTKKKMYEYDRFLRELLEQVKENRIKVQNEKREANKYIDNLINDLKIEEEQYIKDKSKEINNTLNDEFEKLIKEHNRQLRRIKDRFLKDERERDLKLKTKILNINKDHNINLKELDKSLDSYFDERLKDYQKNLNEILVRAKIETESLSMDNEFKRNNIISKELYKKR